MTLAQKVGSAGILLIVRRVWGALVSFGVMAYLARELSKEDFGILAISSLLLKFIQIFAISGISDYVIFYRGKDEKDVINSAFWLNMVMTVVIIIFVLLVLPFWSKYHDDERIVNIVYLLSIGFFLNMLSSIPNALFRKELRYKPLIMIQTIINTITNIGKVGFAFFGFGIYSLVLPNLITAPFLAFFLIYSSKFIPKRNLGTKYWKMIFGYTKYVIGQRVFGKLVNESDTFFVGRFYGMVQLGVYNLAFQLSSMFIGYILPIVSNVSLPVISKNKDDLPLVQRHYIKMIRLVTFISFPIIGTLIVGADLFISILYGPKWGDAVLPFQILSVFIMSKTIGSPSSSLFNALGKPNLIFRFTVALAIIFVISLFIIGKNFQFIEFVLGLAFIRVIADLILIVISLRLIKLEVSSFLRLMGPQIIIAISSLISVLFISQMTGVKGVIAPLCYVLLYLSLLLIFRKSFIEVWNDILKMVPNKVSEFIIHRLTPRKFS